MTRVEVTLLIEHFTEESDDFQVEIVLYRETNNDRDEHRLSVRTCVSVDTIVGLDDEKSGLNLIMTVLLIARRAAR